MTYPDKNKLFSDGCSIIHNFCEKNDIDLPTINRVSKSDWHFDVCAYYRQSNIFICIDKCAHVGTANRAWSYPGYVIDRTPYGVLAHELGHHVDLTYGEARNAYWSEFGTNVRKESKEAKLTNYCPNDAEWFAEMFRLFVTNPDLLRLLKPKTYKILIQNGFKPRNEDTWDDILFVAPNRTYAMAEKKLGID